LQRSPSIISTRTDLVSIIVLNFNGFKFVERCLNSLFVTDYPAFEVLFVDNGSSDGSAGFVKKKYGRDPRLVILSLGRNYGFAEGNNIGVKNSHGNTIVFLNIDTEVDPMWLKEAIKVMMNDPTIGIGQCKLLQMDTAPPTLDCAGAFVDVLGFTHAIGASAIDTGQYDRASEIFYAKGAAMVVKRHVLDEVGLFDPDTFLGRDDVDLCWRVWLRGYKVVFLPKSIVHHFGSGIVKQEIADTVAYHHFVKNHIALLVKNYEIESLIRYLPVLTFVYMGLAIRFFLKKSLRNGMAIIDAFVWNVRNIRKTLIKRWIVNRRIRHVTDKSIIDKLMMNLSTLIRFMWKKEERGAVSKS